MCSISIDYSYSRQDKPCLSLSSSLPLPGRLGLAFNNLYILLLPLSLDTTFFRFTERFFFQFDHGMTPTSNSIFQTVRRCPIFSNNNLCLATSLKSQIRVSDMLKVLLRFHFKINQVFKHLKNVFILFKKILLPFLPSVNNPNLNPTAIHPYGYRQKKRD